MNQASRAAPAGSRDQTRNERLAFEQLVSHLLARLIGCSEDKIDEEVIRAFRRLGEHLDADLVGFCWLSEKGRVLPGEHLWFSDRFERDEIAAFTVGNLYPSFAAHMLQRRALVFGSLEEHPAWPEELRYLHEVGITAGVIVRLSGPEPPFELFTVQVAGRKRAWPEELVERFRFLGQVFSAAIHRKLGEKALRHRLRFEQLTSEILACLISCPAHEIHEEVDSALARIGEHLDARNVALVRLSESGELLDGSHLWFSDDVDVESVGSLTRGKAFPDVVSQMTREDAFVFRNLDEHPPWPAALELLQRAGITAGVVVRVGGSQPPVEIFAVSDGGGERDWSADMIERFRFLGHVFSNALYRKVNEQQLKEALDEIKTLNDRLDAENLYLRSEVKGEQQGEAVIGDSLALRSVIHKAEQVAATDSTVLLLGETGTGKDLIARAVHARSDRRDRPMITINCATLPATLIESELFGHEKGAFTGAMERKIGRFELADDGTIFLDEIGDLSLDLQVKLLRVLETGEFERLGSTTTIKVNVRVIAATSRDLLQAVDRGDFRQDLYYRLNVFPIELPPLRHRQEDIPLLVWYFIGRMQGRFGKRIKRVTSQVMEKLTHYKWPGNVRELRNVVERALILSPGAALTIDEILQGPARQNPVASPSSSETLADIERAHVVRVLEECNWKVGGKNGAAECLGLKRGTLQYRMKKLGIERPTRLTKKVRARIPTTSH
jgi:transcriptional regulator with GAF, ATPase, and Fis domain